MNKAEQRQYISEVLLIIEVQKEMDDRDKALVTEYSAKNKILKQAQDNLDKQLRELFS